MMKKNLLILTVSLTLFFGFSWPLASKADNMSIFLKSCAYGALIGAAAGLASLAISDNPSGKMNNVARGASLGLYAGIGYGAYMLNNPKTGNADYVQMNDSENRDSFFWISPVIKKSGSKQSLLTGAEVHWVATTF